MRRDLRFRVRSFDILGAKYLINEIIAEVGFGANEWLTRGQQDE